MGVIYRATNLYPQNVYIDGSANNNFTATINGAKATHYQLKIFTLANVSVYDSTKLALSPNLANGATLSHTVPSATLTNGTQYKWTLQVWNDADSATTREILFNAYSTPVVTFNVPTTITSQEYEFTATYIQSENIGLSYYKFSLYDSEGLLIEQSQNIYDFDIKYTFDGLVSGEFYSVKVYIEFQVNGMNYESSLEQFGVSYQKLDVSIVPSVEFDRNTSYNHIYWGEVIQIIGTTSGSNSYVDNFIRDGNTGLNLANSSSYVSFDVDIPLDFSLKFIWTPDDSNFTGKIIQLDDGVYELGYDNGKFIYTINGVGSSTLPIDLFGSIFYFVLLPTEPKIYKLQLFDLWNNYVDKTWQDVLNHGNWKEILLI